MWSLAHATTRVQGHAAPATIPVQGTAQQDRCRLIQPSTDSGWFCDTQVLRTGPVSPDLSTSETHSADTTSDRHLIMNVSELICAPSRCSTSRGTMCILEHAANHVSSRDAVENLKQLQTKLVTGLVKLVPGLPLDLLRLAANQTMLHSIGRYSPNA